MKQNKKLVMIGCGGGGGYLASMLVSSPLPLGRLDLRDGDFFEPRNSRRQIYTQSGENKAKVLAQVLKDGGYETTATPEFLQPGDEVPADLVVCAVDNNHGRRAALDLAIRNKAPLLVMANEAVSYQALFVPAKYRCLQWLPEWYPEWFSDEPAEPVHVSCSNPEADPQSSVANMGGALMGYHLLRAFLPYLDYDQAIRVREVVRPGDSRQLTEEPVSGLNQIYGIPVEFIGSKYNMKVRYLC